MAESVADFSSRIKTRYPEYSEIDDFELVKRITDKYPEYVDKVDMVELSKGRRKTGIGRVADTAYGYAKKVGGAVSKVMQTNQETEMQASDIQKPKPVVAPSERLTTYAEAAAGKPLSATQAGAEQGQTMTSDVPRTAEGVAPITDKQVGRFMAGPGATPEEKQRAGLGILMAAIPANYVGLVSGMAIAEIPNILNLLGNGNIKEITKDVIVDALLVGATKGVSKIFSGGKLVEKLIEEGVDKNTALQISKEVNNRKISGAVLKARGTGTYRTSMADAIKNFRKGESSTPVHQTVTEGFAQPGIKTKTPEELQKNILAARLRAQGVPEEKIAAQLSSAKIAVKEPAQLVGDIAKESPALSAPVGRVPEEAVAGKIGLGDAVYKQVRTTLNNAGESGKKLVRIMDDRWNYFRQNVGTAIHRIGEKSEKLKGAEFEEVADVLDGIKEPSSERVKAVADMFRKVDDYVFAENAKIGGTTKYLKSHFPRILKMKKVEEMVKGSEAGNDLLQRNMDHLVKSGQAKDEMGAAEKILASFDGATQGAVEKFAKVKEAVARKISKSQKISINEAFQRLKYALREGKTRISGSGFLEKERVAPKLLPEMYIRDIREAAPLYFDNVFNHIASKKFLGDKAQLVEGLMSTAKLPDVQTANRVKRAVERELLGYDPGTSEVVTKWLKRGRSFQTKAKLSVSPFAWMKNFVGGSSRTAADAGYTNYLHGLASTFSKSKRDVAYESGAIISDVLTNLKSGGEKSWWLSKNPLWKLFTKAENVNRLVAYHAGERYILGLSRKANSGSEKAARQLSRFLPADEVRAIVKDGSISDDLLKRAAREFSDKSQGTFRATGLPAWMSTEAGQSVAQFNQMAYRGTLWLNEAVIKELKKGNMAPAARLLGGLVVGGSMVTVTKDFYDAIFREDLSQKQRGSLEQFLRWTNNAEILGMYNDLASLGLKPNTERLIARVAGATATTVANFAVFDYKAAQKIMEGDVAGAISEGVKFAEKEVRPVKDALSITGMSPSQK